MQVVVAFIRGTHEALAGTGSSHGGWGGGGKARGWADTPWRRSAVAFLLVSEADGMLHQHN